VDRAVAEEPDVGAQEVGVAREHLAQVRRTGFLLALEEQLEVHRQRHACGAERVDRPQHRDDRRLVVARGARIDPGFAAHGPGDGREGNLAAAVGKGTVAQHGLPWGCRPILGSNRLTIVVRVKDHGARRARRIELTVYGGRASRRLEQPRANPAPLEHPHQVACIRADVDRVGREVRNREQIRQLA
jgi:hypothetical protein